MNKRPLSITVVGWVFICVGCVALVAGVSRFIGPGGPAATPESDHQNAVDLAWVVVSEILAVAGGAFVLRGSNRARWLLVVWMGFHIALSMLHSPLQLIVHALLFAVMLYLLFHPSASAYFRGVRSEAL